MAMITVIMIVATPCFADHSVATDGSGMITIENLGPWQYRFSSGSDGVWDLGDGTVARGSSIIHDYTVSGMHSVRFFPSSGSMIRAVVLCVDAAFPSDAVVGGFWSWCPGSVQTVATDCPGLSWDASSRTLRGIPLKTGTFQVTQGPATHQLHVSATGIRDIDTGFSAVVSDGSLALSTSAADLTGARFRWDVRIAHTGDLSAGPVYGPSIKINLSPGLYVVTSTITTSSLDTLSRSSVVEIPSTPELSPVSDDPASGIPLWGWIMIAAAVVALLYLLRFVI